MLSFKEALRLIESRNIDSIESEKILFSNGINRVLFKNIHAINDMPLFDTSSMDGYAFCYDDLNLLLENGLEISSINKAGNKNDEILKRGTCIKTFTGSKMPENSDTMILVENVNVVENKIFLKNKNILKGSWIRKKGENYYKDSILFKRGQILSAFSIGLLAQNNNIYIEVFRKPRIALLPIGDEILELGEIPNIKNYIYSSNNHLLNAIFSSMGCEVILHSIIKDNKELIKDSIKEALKNCDIVITTGGMSKGDFDFTKDVIKDFGDVLIDGINIRPGRVSSYVAYENKHIFALPGNPISSVVVSLLFIRLIIQKMLSIKVNIPFKKAKLNKKIINNDKRVCFLPASINFENGIYIASVMEDFQSYKLDSLKDAFVVIDTESIEKNEEVNVIFLNDLLNL